MPSLLPAPININFVQFGETIHVPRGTASEFLSTEKFEKLNEYQTAVNIPALVCPMRVNESELIRRTLKSWKANFLIPYFARFSHFYRIHVRLPLHAF